MIIPGFNRYDIDKTGTVVDTQTGEVIKQHHLNGYLVVPLRDKAGNRHHAYIHVLLAKAFIPGYTHGQLVCFKDGNRDHVDLSNLVCRTRSEQSTLTYRPDGKKRQSKLNTPETRAMVLNALDAYGAPVTMIELSNSLQVPYSMVRYSMQQLIQEHKALRTEGGYILA